MIDIAKHLRIFNSDPDDDFVTKRTTAIKAIENSFKKKTTIPDLLKLANQLVLGLQNIDKIDPSFVELVEKELKKQSVSFVSDGENLQIISCGLVAALQLIDNVKPTSTKNKLSSVDVFSISIWSGLSFQSPIFDKAKLESLRTELIDASQLIVNSSSSSARVRIELSELEKVTTSQESSEPITIEIMQSLLNIIRSFKINANLDREEIDILWWSMNDWSEIANKKICHLNEAQQVIISSLEIARLLKRLPDKAHHILATRNCSHETMYTGEEVKDQLGELITPIIADLNSNPTIKEFSSIFPFFSILLNSNSEMEINGFKTKRTLSEWSGRALLEGSMINFSKMLND